MSDQELKDRCEADTRHAGNVVRATNSSVALLHETREYIGSLIEAEATGGVHLGTRECLGGNIAMWLQAKSKQPW